jgi:hypothetical protein
MDSKRQVIRPPVPHANPVPVLSYIQTEKKKKHDIPVRESQNKRGKSMHPFTTFVGTTNNAPANMTLAMIEPMNGQTYCRTKMDSVPMILLDVGVIWMFFLSFTTV